MWFECLTCCLDACLSSHLVAFHLMCFSPLKNLFSTSSIASRQIPLLSRFLGLTSTASRQISQSIKPKSCALCLLYTSSTDSRSIEVGFFSIDSRHLLNRLRYPCMRFIFLCFAFFSFVSIASCFSFSCKSMVPCSPHSFYICFLFVSSQFFGFLGPLTIVSKRGRNLRIECHSSRAVINLGENFMLKGKFFLI